MVQVVKCIVVDDSALSRKVVRTALESLPGIEILTVARDGVEAVARCQELQPDFVTMDLEMPRMNGIEAVRRLRESCPTTAAVMVSGISGADITTEALRAGAFDFVLKPSGCDFDDSVTQLAHQLAEKITAIKLRHVRRQVPASSIPAARPRAVVSPAVTQSVARRTSGVKAICIGVSTGGPVALQQVIPLLPKNFSIPILIVQHMPPVFTKSLADQLNRLSQVNVLEATDGLRAEPGCVYIAPGGRQMKVESSGLAEYVRITDDPPVNNARPSVNYLLQSATIAYGGNMAAVILTGMGNDGLKGCAEVRRVGGGVFTQDADSCVVFGMPRCVQDAGLSDEVLPLGRVANKLCELVGQSSLAVEGAFVCR